ncbi:hypothetical protein [Pseudomonas putida]|uniref:hypothetical protein n=1 Tax=Pseudomonas putida TaxID=303 RepID=UPI0016293413|nr:hypothetical protein [Pseudomonas putida]QNG10636.1 hypothetical protein GPM17_20360 [Pseudomonas putida]HDS1059332.1 hypothetical protein [Pseudomonas putida]
MPRLLLLSERRLNSPVDYLIAQADAKGAWLGLDMGHVLPLTDIDRLEILFDNVASQRLAELGSDAQP